MKKLVFTFVLGCVVHLSAQSNLSALWLRHTCGYTNGVNLLGGNVWGDAVCADKFGNSFNAGAFSGNWFVMDTVVEMNENRFYINKYGPNGERLWTAKAKGTSINSIMTATKMACDREGNLYVCGAFGADDSVFMSPRWYPIGSGFVAKYDSTGNNIWCQYIPKTGTAAISFTDMSLTNNHIYICGNMGYGTQSFGKYTFTNKFSQNGVIAKLDLNGNILQAEQLDPNSVNEIYGIEASLFSDKIYLVGQYISSSLIVDGRSLSYTNEATNSFILKMSSSFVAEWMKKCLTYLRPNQTVGYSVPCLKKIELDQLDNIYTAGNGNGDSTIIGSLRYNHRISPTTGSYAQDIYLIKLNSNGQELWMRNGGSDDMDYVNDIITDRWGNSILSVYSGSQSASGLIFGNDTIPQWHGGLVKFDTHGNLIYIQKLQEAKSLKALAYGIDSAFFGTGTGFNPGLRYVNLYIPDCEDKTNGYYNPPYKMVMAKFYDESGDFTMSSMKRKVGVNSIDVLIAPNPTKGVFSVQVASEIPRGWHLTLRDIVGNAIFNYVSHAEELEYDLTDFPPGVYFVEVENGPFRRTMKLLKN